MSLGKGTNRREFIVQAGITALGTSVAMQALASRSHCDLPFV